MNDYSKLFTELTNNFKQLSRRISKFETWEPTSSSPVSVGVGLSSPQAVPANTWTAIQYDVELWDSYSMYSGGVFTFPYAGRYLIRSTTSIVPYAGTHYQRFEFATAALQSRGNYNALYEPFRMAEIMEVSAGETMEMQVYRVGAGLTVGGSAIYTYYTTAQIQLLTRT